MRKLKVFELAKELCVSNRLILSFLRINGMDVKSHMSALNAQQEKMVRDAIAGGFDIKKDTEAEIQLQKETNQVENKEKKGQERSTVRPKKKNLIRVDRPQNAKTQEGKKFHMTAKPAKKETEAPVKKEAVKAAPAKPAAKHDRGPACSSGRSRQHCPPGPEHARAGRRPGRQQQPAHGLAGHAWRQR